MFESREETRGGGWGISYTGGWCFQTVVTAATKQSTKSLDCKDINLLTFYRNPSMFFSWGTVTTWINVVIFQTR